MSTSQNNKPKKNKQASVLITLLLLIGGISVVLAILIITAKPVEQISQINNSKRTTDTIKILNAIHQYIADNKGASPKGMPMPGEAPKNISQNGANICSSLVPKYLPSFPSDPIIQNSELSLNCLPGYDTGYTVSVGYNDNRITISALNTQPPATSVVSVTR